MPYLDAVAAKELLLCRGVEKLPAGQARELVLTMIRHRTSNTGRFRFSEHAGHDQPMPGLIVATLWPQLGAAA